nr:MerR family transcriptional regulator [Oscillospiraceae bacterium]
MHYSIHEVSSRTGLSAHTLRYYEKEGILTNIHRTAGGIRYYTDADMETLLLVRCLKETGMPLSEIAVFIRLTCQGDLSLQIRCDILRRHRENILEQIRQTQQHLERITRKLAYFSEQERLYAAKKEAETQKHSLDLE